VYNFFMVGLDSPIKMGILGEGIGQCNVGLTQEECGTVA